MAKNPTFPTLYDEVLQISISKLREWKYLKRGNFKSGTISWSTNGAQTASISILVNMTIEDPFIKLNYKYGDELREYKIQLVSVPSNLGRGEIWYFLCPKTNRRCRKLYSIRGYFYHREAFRGCMYESQTKSKKGRFFDSFFGEQFKTEELFEQITKPYFKTYYAGKPTKRYNKILRALQEQQRLSEMDWERIFL